MSKASKPAVSWLSQAISTEVKVLMARRDMDTKTLSQACGIKVGRLGYLLRRERSWNIVEVDAVADVFRLSASDLVALAEAAAPVVLPPAQDDYAAAAEGRDGTDEGDYDSA
jgi:hypothetical protein